MDNSLGTPQPAQPVPAMPTTQPVAEPTPPPVGSYEGGGFLEKLEQFRIVYYLTFACLIASAIYNINYHRQALNKLNE